MSAGAVAAVLVVLVVVMLALGAAGYGLYRVGLIDTVYPGTVVEGIDLGGMTRAQAAQALLALGAEKYDGLAVTAQLPLDNELTISAWDAKLTYSAEEAAQAAWEYGRGDGALADAVNYLRARYLGSSSFTWSDPLKVTLDEEAVRAIVAEAAALIDEQLLTSGIEFAADEILITKGAAGMTLDEEEIVQQFVAALLAGDDSGFTYESHPDADETFDFQALHDEIYAQRVDAQLLYARDYGVAFEQNPCIIANLNESTVPTDEDGNPVYPELPEGFDFQGKPYGVTRSVTGVDFDVAAAEAAWNAASYGETVAIPLMIDAPATTTEEIEASLFADALSKNYTFVRLRLQDEVTYEARTGAAGTAGRISNLHKALELINGIELMPGDVFSYNLALGERLPEYGWQPAPAYANNEVTQEYGGGICQVSSTLFNAVLYANLHIVSRDCHQFDPGYLAVKGSDATVSWGAPDFRFCNNTNYPIRIVAWFDEDTREVCVRIVGTDVDHQYVILKFNYWYIDDDENRVSSAAEATGEAAWLGRFVFNEGDDYNTATPIGGGPNYEAMSKYGFHD